MPGKDCLVHVLDWGRRVQANEDLCVFVLLKVEVHYDINFEVLSHYPNHRAVGRLELPIDSIVQNVEKDYGLVSHVYVRVTKKLDEKLFDPLK